MQGARAVDVLLADDNVSRPLESVESLRSFVVAEAARRLQYRPDFQLRWQRTQLKIRHQEELRAAFEAVQSAQLQWDNAPMRQKYEHLSDALKSLVLQSSGYKTFLDTHSELLMRVQDPEAEEPTDANTRKLLAKLEKSQAKLAELEERTQAKRIELDACLVEVPELGELNLAIEEETRLKEALGLTSLDLAVQEADKAAGMGSSERGDSFESQTSTDIMAELVRDTAMLHRDELADPTRRIDETSMIVLKNMKLGCAKAELDFLVCAPSTREVPPPPHKKINSSLPAVSVDVLAIVEVKREPNDIGYAVSRYHEYMPWFAGDDTRYDPAVWVTGFYTKGHFTRPHYQLSDDRTQYFVFTPESFRGIYNPADKLPSALHIVTRQRRLVSVSSKKQGLLFHRACSDKSMVIELGRLLNLEDMPEQQSDNDGQAPEAFDWDQLWEEMKSGDDSIGAEESLRLFAADPIAAMRIHLLVSRKDEMSEVVQVSTVC